MPSHLYSFSFAQRRDWSRLCSPQQEILDYLTRWPREFGSTALFATDTEVTACVWDDEARRWTVTARTGAAGRPRRS